VDLTVTPAILLIDADQMRRIPRVHSYPGLDLTAFISGTSPFPQVVIRIPPAPRIMRTPVRVDGQHDRNVGAIGQCERLKDGSLVVLV